MRGIILTSMALLAMSSAALGQVTLRFYEDDLYVGTGYRSYIVTAEGTNITELGEFSITGSTANPVYQVFNGTGPYTESSWLGNGSASTSVAMDSYVMVGSTRLPDFIYAPSGSIVTGKTPWTEETIGGNPNPSVSGGLGTLNNTGANEAIEEEEDSYLRLAGIDCVPDAVEEFELFHLVLPNGSSATVNVELYTAIWDPEYGTNGAFTDATPSTHAIQVNSLLPGDANRDGQISSGDFAILGSHWLQSGDWGDGDFTGDGQITSGDFAVLGSSWLLQADWYGTAYGYSGTWGGGGESAAPVPEPATLVMLVLGSLCLAGYRLRK